MAKQDSIFYFWVPAPTTFQSGGNLYNLHLINALKEAGMIVRRIDYRDLHTITRAKERKFLFVDTLYLEQYQKLPTGPDITKVLIVHHLESLYPPPGWTADQYFMQFEQNKLRVFDSFLCTSAYTRQYLLDRQLQRKGFIVVPPAIGFETSHKVSDWTNIKVILVANLIKRKGILPFFEALAKLGKGPWLNKLKITVVGSFHFEPAYAEACQEFLQAHPEFEKVIELKGALPHEKTLAAYQEANLFISTAFMETYGMAIQEALAFGLPVLAIKGGNVEGHFLEEKSECLFDNMDALVEKLKLLCFAPEELKKLKNGQSGQLKDWATSARQLIDQLDF